MISSFFAFLLGLSSYWIIGFFTKGIFEKLQSYYGSLLFGLGNKKIQDLKVRAQESCSKIDDAILIPLAGLTEKIDEIVNQPDLPPPEQKIYQKLLAESYQLPILLNKLGVFDDFS